MKASKLLEMKEEIEESKLEEAKLIGQKESFEKELYKLCGTTSISRAEKKTNGTREKLKEKKRKFEEGTEEIESKYPWS